jgi:amino acid transporter
MKKLNKRQIIILAVAGVFILYAAYELLLAGPSNKKTQLVASTSDNASFADALRSDIMSNKITAADTYVAEIAETQWGKNPF